METEASVENVRTRGIEPEVNGLVRSTRGGASYLRTISISPVGAGDT